ncbi:hypothetical protein GCM10017691_40960 [Pseudonocardia petroleophila]
MRRDALLDADRQDDSAPHLLVADRRHAITSRLGKRPHQIPLRRRTGAARRENQERERGERESEESHALTFRF